LLFGLPTAKPVILQPGAGERLFARCFSQKCKTGGGDAWTELTEEHARTLGL